MTKQELNRDIKRLYNSVKLNSGKPATEEYFRYVNNVVMPEIKRLYYADNTLKSLSANSLRMLLRLNVRYRAIPFHQFGLFID